MGWTGPLVRASEGPFVVTVLGPEGGPSSACGIGVCSRSVAELDAFPFVSCGRRSDGLVVSVACEVGLLVVFFDGGGEECERTRAKGSADGFV